MTEAYVRIFKSKIRLKLCRASDLQADGASWQATMPTSEFRWRDALQDEWGVYLVFSICVASLISANRVARYEDDLASISHGRFVDARIFHKSRALAMCRGYR